MPQITLKGNPIHTSGELPKEGSAAPAFTLVRTDLSDATLGDFAGRRVVLNPTQLVPEITKEPNYEAAAAVLK